MREDAKVGAHCAEAPRRRIVCLLEHAEQVGMGLVARELVAEDTTTP